MKIGYRTLKTAVGTPIAILIAELLQLNNYVSAGIITILCIQPTRKKSILSSWHRMGACLVAMGLSFIVFETVGYQPYAIGMLLIIFIPITVKLNITPGIVTSSVILLHLYSSSNITFALLGNELMIIIIGIGIALLTNLYMPSLDKNLIQIQEKIERNFGIILKEIAYYLREGEQSWSGKELIETGEMLNKAEKLVLRDIENHLFQDHNPYYEYFKMRNDQFDLLRRMLPLASQMPGMYEQSYHMADFFDELAEAVHPGNTAKLHLQTIQKLRQNFSQDELPKTRKEFESRANLFRLLNEIENYLLLKKNNTPKFKKEVQVKAN